MPCSAGYGMTLILNMENHLDNDGLFALIQAGMT